jgi:hypothetical protein
MQLIAFSNHMPGTFFNEIRLRNKNINFIDIIHLFIVFTVITR